MEFKRILRVFRERNTSSHDADGQERVWGLAIKIIDL